MTPDELLKPRYEVIADYPKNPWRIGDILYPFDKKLSIAAGLPEIERYPHLFKPLQWWERREEKDMPQYVKHTLNGRTTYHKIERWDMEIMVGYLDSGNRHVCSILSWKPEYTYQPATESEYDNYINSQQ